MSRDDDRNENLDTASDFFGGLKHVRDTSKVTHQAMYNDMLSSLMEEFVTIEDKIDEHSKRLAKLKKRVTDLDRKYVTLVTGCYLLVILVFIFLIIAISKGV